MANTNHHYRDIAQQFHRRELSVPDSFGFNFLLPPKRIERDMYTKLIVWMFMGVGLPAYLLSWLDSIGWIDIGGAKGFILFCIAVLTAVARLTVYVVESIQKYQYRRKKIRNMK